MSVARTSIDRKLLPPFPRIAALAILSIVGAFRSRLFIALALMLLLTVIGLPMAIKGDGTLVGQVRLILTYSLGVVTFILGAATLWSACGAVSQEIQEKNIQILATKPVHRLEIWIGKWLGLLAVNALLLTLAGSALYVVVACKTRLAVTTGEQRQALSSEVLLARRLVEPRNLPVDDEAHAELERLRTEGKLPDGVVELEVLDSIRDQLRMRKLSVSPGQSNEWRFLIPARASRDATIVLRYRFSGSSRYRTPASGIWQIVAADGKLTYTQVIQDQQGGPYTLTIPNGAVRPGRELLVRFSAAPRGETASIVFDHKDGLQLLIRESSFGANYARTLVIIFCHLALVAAVGLSAGTFFSFPVAAFVSTCLLVISVLAGSYRDGSHAGCGDGHAHNRHDLAPEQFSALFNRAGELLIQQIDVVVSPVMRLNPVGRMSDGILVSWGMLARSVGLMLLLYPAVLGCVGGMVLARRELALPATQGM